MADNLTLKDGNGDPVVVRTTDNAGVHTRHVNVDASALPTGAATEAKQDDGITELQTMVTSLASMLTELQQANGHTQTVAYTAIDTTDPTDNPEMNGAAINVTPAPTKKLVIDHVSFYVKTTAGTPLASGEVITVELLEETSGQVLGRKQFTVSDVTAQGLLEYNLEFPELVGVKLSTTAKRLQVKVYGHDGSYTPVDKFFTADLNVFYHEED